MTSQILECEGLVLRNLRYGDTSRVATLFTDALGKISVIAKGVRDPKSPLGSSLELFMRSSFVLYFRSGRDLQLIRAGSVEREYPALLRTSRRFAYGCAVVEYLDRMLLEEEPAQDLYQLSLRVLERLQAAPLEQLPELFAAFQLRGAALLGYAPLLEHCLHCKTPVPGRSAGATQIWLFRPSEGGAFCSECSPGVESGFPLTLRALLRIRAMTQMGSARRDGAGWVRDESREGSADEEPRDEVRDDAAEEHVRAGSTAADGAHETANAGATAGDGARDAASDGPAPAAERRARWNRTLEQLVDDFLGYHVERYRGLRSLGRGLPRGDGPTAGERRVS